jgi:predicted kinase
MQMVIFIGIQGAGKSTFFKKYFFDTHIRINLDMLKTKHREKLLTEACFEAKQPFVIDKTNATIEQRAKYIALAKKYKFMVAGYYFASDPAAAIERNNRRTGKAKIPEKAIHSTYSRLQIPAFEEGFDELFYVKIDDANNFIVENRQTEVLTNQI